MLWEYYVKVKETLREWSVQRKAVVTGKKIADRILSVLYN